MGVFFSVSDSNPTPIHSDNPTKSETEDTKKGGKHLFKPGISGNPSGRPKGSKNRTTEITEQIQSCLLNNLEGDALEILEVAKRKALEGDRVLLKFFLERFLPAASSGVDSMGDGKNQLQIIIKPMNSTVEEPPREPIEDASYEEVEEEVEEKENPEGNK